MILPASPGMTIPGEHGINGTTRKEGRPQHVKSPGGCPAGCERHCGQAIRSVVLRLHPGHRVGQGRRSVSLSHAWSSAPSDQPDAGTAAIAGAAALSRLIYRSRVVHPLSSLELYKLALAAQSRNRNESITGLVLYDKGSFFQWLEGPAEGLERVMRSIRNDSRHTDIEVLGSEPATARVFADWSMKLASVGQSAASWRQDVMEPPPDIIETLRRNPHAAPALLATLIHTAPGVPADRVMEFRASPRVALGRQTAAVLKAVILQTVVPGLAVQHGIVPAGSHPQPVNKRADELAELLIGADQSGALELIREVQAATPPSLQHYATLFEPAARKLGDLWGEDACTEFDVALGLSRMQSAVRLLSAGIVHRRAAGSPKRHILIAPEPGELHRLGAALDSDVMRTVGWDPHCEYPRDDHALEDLVAGSWFDVLDLSLSAAFSRRQWLPRLKKTIAAARHASRNPALVVIVGGRLFAEHLAVGAQVGADAASTTAVLIGQSITECLPQEG